MRTTTPPTDLSAAIALLKAREDELEALEDLLDGGREFYLDGTERPTTLLDRVRLLCLAVGAESQAGDEARRDLGAARQHVQEYRRCLRVALDEQREAGEKQDLGVMMTDIEDLLDLMADESPLSRDPEPEPETFTFEVVGPTNFVLPDDPQPGVSIRLTNLVSDETIIRGSVEGDVVLGHLSQHTFEAVRVEGPVEPNQDPPTVWKKVDSN